MILAKVLSSRSNMVIAHLVDSDQGGFIPGRSTRMNICRWFHILLFTHAHSCTQVNVSLKTCKAFDSVKCPCLLQYMSCNCIDLEFVWLSGFAFFILTQSPGYGLIMTFLTLLKSTKVPGRVAPCCTHLDQPLNHWLFLSVTPQT